MFFTLASIYLVGVTWAITIHIARRTPFPETAWEFIKLTFLPYAIALADKGPHTDE